MRDLMISEQITEGVNGKIYLGYRGKEKYIVKHTETVSNKHFSNEICNQHLASQHDITPKIYTYWK